MANKEIGIKLSLQNYAVTLLFNTPILNTTLNRDSRPSYKSSSLPTFISIKVAWKPSPSTENEWKITKPSIIRQH